MNYLVGSVCDDGDPCTVESVCADDGRCVGQRVPAGTACDDGNACSTVDVCDADGRCTGTPLTAGALCDDGNLCTLNDVCAVSPGGGVRCSGELKDCGDGDACTTDLCAPTSGECYTAPVVCQDANPCTNESCDPRTGCVHEQLDGVGCSDYNSCTSPDRCVDGVCVSGQNCPPPGPCQILGCNPDGPWGCEYSDVSGVHCDAGDCRLGFCVRGFCESWGYSPCDDENVCTADTCDATVTNCTHTAIPGPCSDGNLCTADDYCAAGRCQPGPAIRCDDSNACTTDSCDPQAGCVHVPGPDTDADGFPDACDVCPTVRDPSQDPCGCANCGVFDIVFHRSTETRRPTALLTWRTEAEFHLQGFNVLLISNSSPEPLRLNAEPIPCASCTTGGGGSYSFPINRRRDGHSIYVETIEPGGGQRFGPAEVAPPR